MSGHYWCDKCDEPAFGAACQHCHQPARFVADSPAPLLDTERERRPKPVTPVSLERGLQLFAQLKSKLNIL
jgi:hypothetical protein